MGLPLLIDGFDMSGIPHEQLSYSFKRIEQPHARTSPSGNSSSCSVLFGIDGMGTLFSPSLQTLGGFFPLSHLPVSFLPSPTPALPSPPTCFATRGVWRHVEIDAAAYDPPSDWLPWLNGTRSPPPPGLVSVSLFISRVSACSSVNKAPVTELLTPF